MKLLALLAIPYALFSQQRTVSIPVSIAAQPNRPPARTECLVPAGPAWPLSALAFSPDGKLLAAGGYQEVLLWNLEAAKLERAIGGLGGGVRAIAFRKDGRTIAAAGGSPAAAGWVRLIDVASGAVLATLDETSDEMLAAAFSPDGVFLAAGGTDGAVRVWSVDDRKLAATLKGHTGWINSVAFSADGKLLASASADRTAQVWTTAKWEPAAKLPQLVTEPVTSVAFSPDNDILAFSTSGADERAIRVWRTENAFPKDQQRRDNLAFTRPFDMWNCAPLSIAWSRRLPNRGRPIPRIFVGCEGNLVRVTGPNGGIQGTLTGHTDWVYGVAVHPDGIRVASSSGDGTVKLWSSLDYSLLATLVELKPRSPEWLIMTPRAFHTTTASGLLKLKNEDLQPYLARMENATAVRAALAGPPPPPPPKPAKPAAGRGPAAAQGTAPQ